MAPRFKVGIVGAGYVSGHHLRALQSIAGAEVIAICDLDLERARQVAKQFRIPHACSSAQVLLELHPDVVHVLTPPDSHCSVAVQALDAGCHVLVEKPMAESVAECDQMMQAAARAGRILWPNHSARMDPIVLRVVEIARRGDCGEILSVSFIRSSDYAPYRGGPLPAPYRRGSYPFEDLGVHAITIFESFLGQAKDATLDFRCSGRDANRWFDEWSGTVECERGMGHVLLSWNARPISSQILVHGTRGSIHVDCFLQTCRVTRVYPGPKFLSNVASRVKNSAADLFTVPWNVVRFITGSLKGAPGIHVSVKRFYEALAGTTPEITPEEGRRVVALAAAICARADNAKEADRAARLLPLPPTRVLVTGAGGFLGRRLVARLLERNIPIRVFVRRREAWQEHPLIQVVEGDLGDPDFVRHAVDGVELVYHVGAAMKGGTADFERGTVWGTRNIVDACLAFGVKRLVYVSSLSVLDFAGHRKGVAVTEDSPYEPHAEKRGQYTQTKLEAELIVRRAIAERGLRAVILRPGQIFGPGAERVTPGGVIGLGSRWLVVGNGKRKLPLVYVDDVVDALELAAENPAALGKIYNIVDSDPVSQRDYLKALGYSLAGIRIRFVPQSLLLLLGLACEMGQKILRRPLPLSRYRVRSIRPLEPFDLSASFHELGWAPVVGARSALLRMSTPTKSFSDKSIAAGSRQETVHTGTDVLQSH